MTEQGEQTLNKVLEYWRMVTRHWRLVVIGVGFCLLLFVVIIGGSRTSMRRFTAILVDPQQVRRNTSAPR